MSSIHPEVEVCIRKNIPWLKLSDEVKQKLGQSHKEYEKAIVTFSVKNQIRFKGNLVRHVRKDEKKYYTDLITYSQQSLMLFPYHLSDVIINGLRITPFQYYVSMLELLMTQEKSYDSLPNFTAADCLRLLGIGRNQYIDLMNMSRSSRKFVGFFSRKSGKDLLPSKPVGNCQILPWWMLQIAYITEDDMKAVDKAEHALIDQLIDCGSFQAGNVDYTVVLELFRKGLVYFDVPIDEHDYVHVPPLEGFVMNRVLGDYFETLLYKIFVSIDENTTVGELANVLEIDTKLVRDAISLYCRLGFAKKKNSELDSNDIHPSWYDHMPNNILNYSSGTATVTKTTFSLSSEDEDDSLLKELNLELEADGDGDSLDLKSAKDEISSVNIVAGPPTTNSNKKIAFLFDSYLTGCLMMGNLSPGLKNLAVTMFEVGKFSEESLDSLVTELSKVSRVDGEGEAERYFSIAVTLKDTIQFLRQNPLLRSDNDEENDKPSESFDSNNLSLGLDLLRCESLHSLDSNTVDRLLKKNYSLLVSMSPLTNEVRLLSESAPPHLGPPIPIVSSLWFKMFLYHKVGNGPKSLLLSRGTRVRKLPALFNNCQKLLVTSWNHEPSEVPISGALTMLWEALKHLPVLIQAIPEDEQNSAAKVDLKTKSLAFPIADKDNQWHTHEDLKKVCQFVDTFHSCGYVTLMPKGNPSKNLSSKNPSSVQNKEPKSLLEEEVDSIETPLAGKKKMSLDVGKGSANADEQLSNWIIMDLKFGIPLFDPILNKEICNRIVDYGLWKKDSLDLLSEGNLNLRKDVISFVEEFNLQSMDNIKMKSDSDVPYPSRNILFDGSKLSVWNA